MSMSAIDEAVHTLEGACSLRPIRESYVLLAELLDRHGVYSKNAWHNAKYGGAKCTNQTQGYLRREEVWTEEFYAKICANADTPLAPPDDGLQITPAISQLLELYVNGKIDATEYVTVINELAGTKLIDLATFIAAEAERKAQ